MADRLVIETTVLIDLHRRLPAAKAIVDGLLANDAAVVHPVSAAEMLDGATDRQNMLDTFKFLAAFRRIPVKSVDHERCLF